MTKLYHLMERWGLIMEVGNTPPLDIFPFLKAIPDRFLGSWKSRALEVNKEMNGLYASWLDHVIERRDTQGPGQCMMEQVLAQQEKPGFGTFPKKIDR